MTSRTPEPVERCQSSRGGMRCGLEEGHEGDHTAMMETGVPWFYDSVRPAPTTKEPSK